jgi:hypothetical protein
MTNWQCLNHTLLAFPLGQILFSYNYNYIFTKQPENSQMAPKLPHFQNSDEKSLGTTFVEIN